MDRTSIVGFCGGCFVIGLAFAFGEAGFAVGCLIMLPIMWYLVGKDVGWDRKF